MTKYAGVIRVTAVLIVGKNATNTEIAIMVRVCVTKDGGEKSAKELGVLA